MAFIVVHSATSFYWAIKQDPIFSNIWRGPRASIFRDDWELQEVMFLGDIEKAFEKKQTKETGKLKEYYLTLTNPN